jgi:hypothetical protein
MRLRTRVALWKIRSRQRKSDRTFNRLVKESGKSVEACSSESWYADLGNEDIGSEIDERLLMSDELRSEASRLYLPIPSLSDGTKWDSDHTAWSPRPFMTHEAITELRSAIRKERAERRAVFEWWLKVLGGTVGILTGLVGALIGLIAIWKK